MDSIHEIYQKDYFTCRMREAKTSNSEFSHITFRSRPLPCWAPHGHCNVAGISTALSVGRKTFFHPSFYPTLNQGLPHAHLAPHTDIVSVKAGVPRKYTSYYHRTWVSTYCRIRSRIPGNTKCWIKTVLLLGKRRKCWPNNTTKLG